MRSYEELIERVTDGMYQQYLSGVDLVHPSISATLIAWLFGRPEHDVRADIDRRYLELRGVAK